MRQRSELEDHLYDKQIENPSQTVGFLLLIQEHGE